MVSGRSRRDTTHLSLGKAYRAQTRSLCTLLPVRNKAILKLIEYGLRKECIRILSEIIFYLLQDGGIPKRAWTYGHLPYFLTQLKDVGLYLALVWRRISETHAASVCQSTQTTPKKVRFVYLRPRSRHHLYTSSFAGSITPKSELQSRMQAAACQDFSAPLSANCYS